MNGTARLDTRQSRAVWLCNQLVDRSWTATYPCTVPLQRAGQLYMGVESMLSKCAIGWPVMYQGGVEAVGLYNGLVDSGRLYIGAAVRLCNGAR